MPRRVYLREDYFFTRSAGNAKRFIDELQRDGTGWYENPGSPTPADRTHLVDDVRLLGDFYACGLTVVRWWKVINYLECAGGRGGGWRNLLATYRGLPDQLFGDWSELGGSLEYGYGEPLGAARSCPSIADLMASGICAGFVVQKRLTVHTDHALRFLDVVAADRAPIMADYGDTTSSGHTNR